MKISKTLIKEINCSADIRDHIPGATSGRGAERYVKCPECGEQKKGKGLCVKGPQAGGRYANTAKCWSCGFKLSGPIAAEMHFGKCDFMTAVHRCAASAKITILEEKDSEDDKPRCRAGSFAWKQLQDSGLKPSQTFARRYDLDGNVVEENIPVFLTGGLDAKWQYTPYDDEMVIRYLDLYGNPVMYARRGAAGNPAPYYRVRYNNPEAHMSREGKPMKYQSPAGSQVCFMIPEYIRERFHRKEIIKTLFIQEGEKKAEKACLHGIPSLAIQGIYNIGSSEGGLIKELQKIIKACSVKNVVLLLDSDWDALSKEMKAGRSVETRPKQFAGAVVKFRQYLQTLHTQDISVDVWFGHVNENEVGAKGIDDLLVGPLKDTEDVLMPSLETAMNSHNGAGVWCDIHKITTLSDFQIYDFWHLNKKDDFFAKHKDEIGQLETVKFRGVRYRKKNGVFEIDTANGGIEKFWHEVEKKKEDNENTGKKIVFEIGNCFQFLEANGFYKVERNTGGAMDIIRIEEGFVSIISAMSLRDFVCDFVFRTTSDREVKDFFMNGRGSLLGQDKLENLQRKDLDILDYERGEQWYFYKNARMKVTAEKIEESADIVYAWKSVKLNRDFERVEIIKDISYSVESGWQITFTDEAKNCEFLQFLMNTCNFWWRESESTDHREELTHHLVNKISSIGYLLTDYKDKSESKAIISMDSKMSEVGQNSGRSGKSLIGTALETMRKTTYVNGRNNDTSSDFMYNEVERDTKLIWLDDIKARFNITRLFNDLTGKLNVNIKGGAKFSLSYKETPKFYITTNHAIEGLSDNASIQDRVCFMSFSDYYGIDRKPVDDFGHLLFDGWDKEQWNLFDNLMLECVMYYMRFAKSNFGNPGRGLIDPPMENIEARTLRQEIGEVFVQWADTYFCEGSSYLNTRLERKTIFDDFNKEYPGFSRIVTPSNFGTKMKKYCQFRGLHFNIVKKNKDTGQGLQEWMQNNPGKAFIGDMDKTHSKEYFTICTDEFAKLQPY